jgi:hypothetical protein
MWCISRTEAAAKATWVDRRLYSLSYKFENLTAHRFIVALAIQNGDVRWFFVCLPGRLHGYGSPWYLDGDTQGVIAG